MRRIALLAVLTFATACPSTHASDHRHEPVVENPPPPSPLPVTPPAGKPGIDVPEKFTNLKVLPADIQKDQLMTAMRGMSQGLGVRCNFCHQMSPKDFAADTPHKETARQMMLMTERINKEIFTWPNAPRATCFMCHHGHEEPELRPPPPAEKSPHDLPPTPPAHPH